MAELLLELFSEEIPARMQARAADDLRKLITEKLVNAGLLYEGAKTRGWSFGQVFVIRHCRVGIINEIGGLLDPKVVVLLIGERPGLATAESLSSYMAYRPNASHTDADRNLISNIHARGVSAERAARRILDLAASMLKTRTSGVQLREDPPPVDL